MAHHLPEQLNTVYPMDSWYTKGWLKDLWNWMKRQCDISPVQTASFSVTDRFFYPCDTTGGSLTATLPPALGLRGRAVLVKKLVAGNTLTVAAQTTDNIDSAATVSITVAGDCNWFISDGNFTWYRLISSAGGGGGGISGITVKEEGVGVGTAAGITSIDFVGSTLTATGVGAAATVTSTAIAGITVKEEGVGVGTAAGITSVDFVGATVTATGAGAAATVTIPSAAPSGASFLTLGLDATLSAERVLTAGFRTTFTDTGANGTLTITVNSPVVSKTANYSATIADYVIFCDASGGSFTITLPAANVIGAGFSMSLRIKRMDSTAGNTVTVARAGADTIDGAATFVLGALQACDLESDGSSLWGVM